jgi:hypothetical protein
MGIEEGKTRITIHFQYQGPHDPKPRDWTQEENLQFETPAGTPVRSIPIPAVGDTVTLTLTQPGQPLEYQVLSRSFSYTEAGTDLQMNVCIIVTDAGKPAAGFSTRLFTFSDRLHWVLATACVFLLTVSTVAVLASARAHRETKQLASANLALRASASQAVSPAFVAPAVPDPVPPKADLAKAPASSQARPASTKPRHPAPPKNKPEHSFYEFRLARSGQYQRVGPYQIAVREVGLLHTSCELLLTMDGHKIDHQRVHLFQPVMLPRTPHQRPLELVVDQITNNSVKGYLTEPKRTAELAALRP